MTPSFTNNCFIVRYITTYRMVDHSSSEGRYVRRCWSMDWAISWNDASWHISV